MIVIIKNTITPKGTLQKKKLILLSLFPLKNCSFSWKRKRAVLCPKHVAMLGFVLFVFFFKICKICLNLNRIDSQISILLNSWNATAFFYLKILFKYNNSSKRSHQNYSYWTQNDWWCVCTCYLCPSSRSLEVPQSPQLQLCRLIGSKCKDVTGVVKPGALFTTISPN